MPADALSRLFVSKDSTDLLDARPEAHFEAYFEAYFDKAPFEHQFGIWNSKDESQGLDSSGRNGYVARTA